jgi:hypothetical protein
LNETYSTKLNRKTALEAKEKVVKDQIFNKMLNYKETVDEIMEENQKRRKTGKIMAEDFLR